MNNELPGPQPENPRASSTPEQPAVGSGGGGPTGEPDAGRGEGWEAVAAQWREVAEQVRELGLRLSAAFHSGWTGARPEAAATVRDELRAAADRLDGAVGAAREAAEHPETRERLQHTGEATRQASETLLAEVRTTTAVGLRALNEQLAALADRLEVERRRGGGPGARPGSD